MPNVEAVWQAVTEHAGEVFWTISGLPFHYEVDGGRLLTDHTNHWIHRSQLKAALDLWPVAGPSALKNVVRGPSYLYALLADPRIMPTS